MRGQWDAHRVCCDDLGWISELGSDGMVYNALRAASHLVRWVVGRRSLLMQKSNRKLTIAGLWWLGLPTFCTLHVVDMASIVNGLLRPLGLFQIFAGAWTILSIGSCL